MKIREKLKEAFSWKVLLLSLVISFFITFGGELEKRTFENFLSNTFLFYLIFMIIAKIRRELKEEKQKKKQQEKQQTEETQPQQSTVEDLTDKTTPQEPEEFELPIRYRDMSPKMIREIAQAADFFMDEISHYLFANRFTYRTTSYDEPERLYLLDLKSRAKIYLDLPEGVKAFEVAIFYNEPMIYVVVYGYKQLISKDPNDEKMHLFLFKINEETGEINRYHSHGQFFLENVKSLLRKNGKYYLKHEENSGYTYSSKKFFKVEVIQSLQDDEAYISKLPDFLEKQKFSPETEELLKTALVNKEFCWGLEEKLKETDKELPVKDLEKLLELAIEHCKLSTQATIIAKILKQTSTKDPEEFKAYFDLYINKGFLEELVNKEREENRKYVSPALKDLGEKLAETPYKQEALKILNLALKYNPKTTVKRLKKKLEKELANA